MQTGKPRMIVPYGLKTLLEGVSRAVLKINPPNIAEFAAFYFRELMIFREGHANLDIKELVKEFHQTIVEGWTEGSATGAGPPQKDQVGDGTAPTSDEPKRKEKSTDTEEDQVSQEAARRMSTKTTQYPSTLEFVEEKVAEEKPQEPEPEPEPEQAPAEPPQVAAQKLSEADAAAYDPELKDAAISVQTLPKLSHSSEEVGAAPAEVAPAEEEPPAPEAARVPSAQSVRAEPTLQSQPSVLQEAAASGSQAELPPADIVEEASPDPLQEEPPPPAPPPPPPDIDPLLADTCPSDIEVTSDFHLTPVGVEDLQGGGEAPPYVEQFPQQIVIPFLGNVACLLDPPTALLSASQFTCASILDPSADDAECDPDRMDTTEQLKPTDPGFIMSVAIPLEDVMTGKEGSGAGDKAPFAGSYGMAGEITFTTAPVRGTE